MKCLHILGISLLALACSCATPDPYAARDIAEKTTKATAELKSFLSQPVEERFELAMAANDKRYLALYGIELTVPVPNAGLSYSDLLIIPGSDFADIELRKEALAYASKYNEMVLLKRKP